jgi:hypothetical protein
LCDDWAFYWNFSEIHSIQTDWHHNLHTLNIVSSCKVINQIMHEYLSISLSIREQELYWRGARFPGSRFRSFLVILHLQGNQGNFYYRYQNVARSTIVELRGLIRHRPRYLR